MRARKRKADVATMSWNNIHENAHMLIPTPDKDDDPVSLDYSHFIHLSVVPTRATPLPALGWANREDVWKNMMNKEETYVRDKHYMQRHPQLQPKMRTVLLDWLMEVCEAYKLHRETFYLAQDFFDRFMATQQDVVKTLLQLIGVTSLFIAAKLEEIYPPKLHQFAYVTDGACTEDEIVSMELIIMKALNWNLNPLTVVSWLNVYMQVAYLNELYELLDLCVLDIGCLEYTYGILAASALYHFSSSELMQKVSGYEFCEIEECVKWMVPFAMALREVGSSKLKHFSGIAPEDLHNIQTHINSFDLLVSLFWEAVCSKHGDQGFASSQLSLTPKCVTLRGGEGAQGDDNHSRTPGFSCHFRGLELLAAAEGLDPAAAQWTLLSSYLPEEKPPFLWLMS
ncbi:G1/S-specific cyclin-E1 [Willisornis vidua]|uniref:G1/S-specific cyclin-E1 n=1 Tax=Willisornis vidua TaxID=1566151 RepID=A0ABQ9DIM6_9PASS|nr:G1/S-specific cyclin-E1 [Willisornis vidua]